MHVDWTSGDTPRSELRDVLPGFFYILVRPSLERLDVDDDRAHVDPRGNEHSLGRDHHDEPRRVKLSPRVLIVDASRESREVLRMLLELRGATTIEAEGPAQALQLTYTLRPDLILLDTDSDATSTGTPTNDLREAASRNHTPIVILGKLRQLHGELESGQIVTKPYHYGPLIRKIDGLLAAA